MSQEHGPLQKVCNKETPECTCMEHLPSAGEDMQAHYRDHGKMTYARSVLTLHNMAYQGRGPFAELEHFEIPDNYQDAFFLDDPVGGEHMNIMKAGIITASRVVAVSAGYAWEIKTPEGGWGLHMVLEEQSWKLCGIANGIDYDEWHPSHDGCLTSDGYTQYSEKNLIEGKRTNKAALQRELGLPENPDVPLLGFIGRMDYQKGVDFIQDSYSWLMGEGVQLVMLGSGREDLESALRQMENDRKDQCRCD
jgi:starch synthase